MKKWITLLIIFISSAQGSVNEVIITENRRSSIIIGQASTFEEADLEVNNFNNPFLEFSDITGNLFGSELNREEISLRGSLPGHTLVLVDGNPIIDPTSINGGSRFDHLPLDNIKKIEIYKGANSVLFGENALNGAINIVTKNGNKPGQILRYQQGSYGKSVLYGEFKDKINNGILTGSIKYSRSDGLSIYPDRNGDSDGHDLKNIYFSYYYPQSNLDWKLSFNYQDQILEYDHVNRDSLDSLSTLKKFTFTGDLNYFDQSLNTKISNNITIESIDRIEQLNVSEIFHYNLKSFRNRLTAKRNFSFGNLIGGIDYQQNFIGEYTELEKENIYESDLRKIDFFTLLSKEFNSQSTVSVGSRLFVGSKNKVDFACQAGTKSKLDSGTWGLKLAQGIRRPSFYEKFSIYGNQSLKNEKSLGIDLSWSQNRSLSSKFKMSFELFMNRVTNYIQYNTESSLFSNIGGVNQHGFKISSQFNLNDDLDFDSSLFVTENLNRETQKILPGKNIWKWILKSNYKLRKNSLLTSELQAHSKVLGMNNDEIKGQLVSSVSLNHYLKSKERINIALKNIFKAPTQSIFPQSNPGRIVYLTYENRW